MDPADLINHQNLCALFHKPESNGSTHKTPADHTYIIISHGFTFLYQQEFYPGRRIGQGST